MTAIGQFGNFLRQRQRWVLLAMLAGLHLTLLAGAQTTIGLMCWLVDVGFFILWQPFVQAERRLETNGFLWLLLVLVSGAALFSWWLLILWTGVLAALLGGRVLLHGHRPTRLFFLLAFAYLLFALLVYLVPKVVPNPDLLGPSFESQFAWLSPLILLVMLALPERRESPSPGGGMVDFFYSVFLFLLISVLVLGSLAFMLLRQSLYLDAVFRTMVSMAAVLLLMAWAWNPRPGFSGIGVHLSRYLLTAGLPFETWLQGLMEAAESENDPDRFLARALEGMLDLPWVTGVAWLRAGDGAKQGFGQPAKYRQDFPGQPLTIFIDTRHKLSPSMVWLFHLLTRLINEYYLTRQRARDLQQMSYLRAVHETGARLTHDIKNLLQSLNNLCYLAQLPESGKATDDAQLTQTMRRQLPQITHRLQQTLEKLQAPERESGAGQSSVPAAVWWESLQQRYMHESEQGSIDFAAATLADDASLPALLFDSVADNLLHNALLKRQSEASLRIRVALTDAPLALSVCDTGSAVQQDLVASLMRAPVPSESGLGIGLYHASRQAEIHGFTLRLASNHAGKVCFELRKR